MVALLVFVSCGVPGGGGEDDPFEDIGDLDAQARAACEVYTPKAEDIRSDRLTGPPLYRALQDVYNQARGSQTESFAFLVQSALNAAIGGDQETRDARLERLDEVCAG